MPANASKETLEAHGLLPAVKRSLGSLFASPPAAAQPLLVADLPLPTSPVITAITAFARSKLPVATFNHSMRVFYFGSAIVRQHLPSFKFTPETLLLLCLLHDLGTCPDLLESTVLSFEYSGAIRGREELLKAGAPETLADSVCEAIIRHQDVGEEGMMSALTAIVQVATLFDNSGTWGELVHDGTVDDVVAAWPREKWSGCFRAALEIEGREKPWCHTTFIGVEAFRTDIKNNERLNKYEIE
ncbi:urea hydro-lyase/cyanamide hydratase [Geopyxis carbonaria]|nr:urea hydro-lyase/cyanamide hydratase [Geopyxis carbonaria]